MAHPTCGSSPGGGSSSGANPERSPQATGGCATGEGTQGALPILLAVVLVSTLRNRRALHPR